MRKRLSVSAGDAVIDAVDLEKRFGRVWALDGLNLTVLAGEVHGFLGPNGAGKSTTIRTLLGQLRLDGGEAWVFGRDPWFDAVSIHEHLAYVPGDVSLWPELTGGECIDVLGGFQGNQNRRRRGELIDRFQLDPTKRTRTYSKGNRQKVALIAALATDVELLLLDEPTSGLDPVMEAEFQSCVREAVDRGATVLLSSHILGEVEALCDRVSIIRDGADISTGTLDELRHRAATTIELTTDSPLPDLDHLESVRLVVQRPLAGGVRTTLRVPAEQVDVALAALLPHHPMGLVVQPPSLDELFLQAYRGDDISSPDGSGAHREFAPRPELGGNAPRALDAGDPDRGFSGKEAAS